MNGSIVKRMPAAIALPSILLLAGLLLGICTGSTPQSLRDVLAALSGHGDADPTVASIVWRIRLPRVAVAGLVGASLSLAGLVFQNLLRNPIAEPYVLGVSGGAAVGAIFGMLLGFAGFPWVTLLAFTGSMATLFMVLTVGAGRSAGKKDTLILAGVMINAFCSSIIMFLVVLTQDSRLRNVLFWLMGDLSSVEIDQIWLLAFVLPPCFLLLLPFARSMNLLLMGEEMAANMGVNVRLISLAVLAVTSFMVSATVCHSGLLGFVGLVVPHLCRMLWGPDNRLLMPSCILGGAAYLVFCDLLARTLPAHGEMPVGIVTAVIGAPLFLFFLVRSRR